MTKMWPMIGSQDWGEFHDKVNVAFAEIDDEGYDVMAFQTHVFINAYNPFFVAVIAYGDGWSHKKSKSRGA